MLKLALQDDEFQFEMALFWALVIEIAFVLFALSPLTNWSASGWVCLFLWVSSALQLAGSLVFIGPQLIDPDKGFFRNLGRAAVWEIPLIAMAWRRINAPCLAI
jgi:hypothetical protein